MVEGLENPTPAAKGVNTKTYLCRVPLNPQGCSEKALRIL